MRRTLGSRSGDVNVNRSAPRSRDRETFPARLAYHGRAKEARAMTRIRHAFLAVAALVLAVAWSGGPASRGFRQSGRPAGDPRHDRRPDPGLPEGRRQRRLELCLADHPVGLPDARSVHGDGQERLPAGLPAAVGHLRRLRGRQPDGPDPEGLPHRTGRPALRRRLLSPASAGRVVEDQRLHASSRTTARRSRISAAGRRPPTRPWSRRRNLRSDLQQPRHERPPSGAGSS